MLCEFYFNKREGKKIERKRGTAGAREASGKAGQVSQMTLGPVDLKGSTESDVKVKTKRLLSLFSYCQQYLLTPLFSILYFLHSYYSIIYGL